MGASVPIEVSQTEGDIDIERKERLLQLRLDGLSRKREGKRERCCKNRMDAHSLRNYRAGLRNE